MPHAVQIYLYVTNLTCYWKTSKSTHLSFKHPVMYQNTCLPDITERHKKPMLTREVSEESEHCWPGCGPGPAVPVPCSLWALSRRKKEKLWRCDMGKGNPQKCLLVACEETPWSDRLLTPARSAEGARGLWQRPLLWFLLMLVSVRAEIAQQYPLLTTLAAP